MSNKAKVLLGAVGVAVILLLGVALGRIGEQAKVGSVRFTQDDFTQGIKVNGTAVIDSSRNITGVAGTFTGAVSGTTIAGTGAFTDSAATGNSIGSGTASSVALWSVGNSVTSTIVYGGANKPVCFSAPACTSAACGSAPTMYWYLLTTTTIQPFAAKPATCP